MRHTRLTITKTLEVTVAWKCSKCHTDNISRAYIQIQHESNVSNTSFNSVEIAKAKLEDKTESTWKDYALDIILDPLKNVLKVRDSLRVYDNGKCKSCEYQEIWAKKDTLRKLLLYLSISIAFMTIILGIYSLVVKEFSIWYVVVLGTCFLYQFLDLRFERMVEKKALSISEECRPYIITNNRELNEYAKKKGKIIYTKAALDQVSKSHGRKVTAPDGIDNVEIDVGDNIDNSGTENQCIRYCHKCGYKLVPDSVYCSKCGEKVI